LRFLGIIFRDLRLEVRISETTEKGEWFFIRFSSFLLYRNCKRLREFEEIEISSKAVEVLKTVNKKEENCQNICLNFVQEFGLLTKEQI
jgi:hypothetical protein